MIHTKIADRMVYSGTQIRPHSSKTGLIYVYTVCSDVSVQKLGFITEIQFLQCSHNIASLCAMLCAANMYKLIEYKGQPVQTNH